MGSRDTIVARSVVLPEPPLTRLPSLTFLSEMRPVIGARTSVHSKFSWAAFSAACATCSCAWATAKLAARWS